MHLKNINKVLEVSIEPDVVKLNDTRAVEVNLSDDMAQFKYLYKHLGMEYPKFYKMDPLSKLGVLVCEFLLTQHPLTAEEREHLTMTFANAGSSIYTDKKYLESMSETASPALFVYTLSNIVQGEVSIRHKIYGESIFFIMPAYDPERLLQEAQLLCNTNAVGGKYFITAWLEYEAVSKFKAHACLYNYS